MLHLLVSDTRASVKLLIPAGNSKIQRDSLPYLPNQQKEKHNENISRYVVHVGFGWFRKLTSELNRLFTEGLLLTAQKKESCHFILAVFGKNPFLMYHSIKHSMKRVKFPILLITWISMILLYSQPGKKMVMLPKLLLRLLSTVFFPLQTAFIIWKKNITNFYRERKDTKIIW